MAAADLAALLADPASVPVERIPAVVAELEKARALLWARLMVPSGGANGVRDDDCLLTLEEAARRLSVTRDWLRRRPTLPFVVKLSEGVVRYSEHGLARYIAARVGRAY